MMADVVNIDVERQKRGELKSFTAIKLAALDRAAVDGRLTHLDFRLLYYLASAVDQETGIARRKQGVIADALGVTRRAVQLSLDRLSECGYLDIQTKDGGTYANGYVIAASKANHTSPLKANGTSPFSKKRRTNTSKKANADAEKGELPFAPIFPFNSLEFPSASRPMPDVVLSNLRKRLGDDVCRCWFGKVAFVSAVDGVVTLVAQTRFLASHINTHFDAPLFDAWRAAEAGVDRVIVVAASAARAPP